MNDRREENKVLGDSGGLPEPDELVPLTQALIPFSLASAFFQIVPDTNPENGLKSIGKGSSNNIHVSPQSQSQRSQRALDKAPNIQPENFSSNNIGISPQSQRALHEVPNINPEICAPNNVDISTQSQSQSQRSLTFLPNFGSNHQLKIGPILPSYEEDNDLALHSRKPEHNGYMLKVPEINLGEKNGSSNKPLKESMSTEFEDGDSCGVQYENPNEDPDPDPDPSGANARTLKRPRLVWTPQLHKRFVDAVAHLGIKGAVPKTIMQLMNVEGLTRENVASHLQKYRLYLKRMQGLSSNDMIGASSVSDQLFASTPVPPGLVASTHFLSNNGLDDVMMPLVMPMSMPMSIMPMPMSIPMPMPMGGMYEHNVYTTTNTSIIRPPSSQKLFSGDKTYLTDSNGHSPSPQKQVLTLFPN